MSDEWIEIVRAQPRAEAEKAFAEWKRANASIPDEAIRKDLISMGPGGGGCYVRYVVRSEWALRDSNP